MKSWNFRTSNFGPRADRLLVAQSMVEGITLLTTDPIVAKYPAPVQRV